MLEFRIRILRDVVDQMIVVEGDVTFQGAAKPWRLEKTLLPVTPHLCRIASKSPWNREAEQRNAIEDACRHLNDSDTVIILRSYRLG